MWCVDGGLSLTHSVTGFIFERCEFRIQLLLSATVPDLFLGRFGLSTRSVVSEQPQGLVEASDVPPDSRPRMKCIGIVYVAVTDRSLTSFRIPTTTTGR